MGESGSTKSSDRLVISPVSDLCTDSSRSSVSSTNSDDEEKSKKDNLNKITADGSCDDPPLGSFYLIKERTDSGQSANLIDSSAVRKKIEELKNFGSMFDKALVPSKGDSEVSGTNTCIDFSKELSGVSESQSMQLQAANQSSITKAPSATVETTGMKQSRKEVPARYRYSREFLLKLRVSPLSLQIPEGLQELECLCKKPHIQGKSIDVSHPGLDRKWNSLKSDVLFYLSRLTVTNVKVIVDELQKINFEVENDLEQLVKIIYEKAILDSKNLKAYAQLCLEMSQLSVPIFTSSLNIAFREVLTKFCTKMFDSEKAYFSRLEKTETSEQLSGDEPDKAEQLKKSTRKLKQRRSKFFGNILFCTELCTVGILQPNFIYKCLRYLLATCNEDSFSVLCQILENVGSQLDTKGMKTEMDNICDSIIKLADSHPKSRASFLEIIDLRHNNWGLSI
ncbi:eukaryotic translation initiation factor 4 gamma 3-like [Physella acuta]|uniref:eukaryotic translation initiation factor 4 gamma 3-like n=1 Tax=Physella acuta TaxID=109671 RepID=UPI0027DC6C30|nr:eukaryotic translation initiation factor 4 gamma 3-like [Physella acuta]